MFSKLFRSFKANSGKQSGFTLIELLVVIAIIGLLATLSVLALNNARAKSRDAKRLADVKQIQTSLELYFNSTGHYPTVEEFNTGKIEHYSSTVGTTTYMVEIPSAPTPADGSCSNSDNNYTYIPNAEGSDYDLNFCVAKSPISSLPDGNLVAFSGGIKVGTGAPIGGCTPACQAGYSCESGSCVQDQAQIDIRASLRTIVASSDLSNMIGVGSDDYIYTSTNSGATWTKGNIAPATGRIVAASDNLSNLLLKLTGTNYLYTSSDSGATWTERTGSGSRQWRSFASSADGSKLAAAVEGGDIYTSADYGVTWIERASSGTSYWSIACSADCSNLIIGSNEMSVGIKASSDFGVTWPRTGSGAFLGNVSSSADGSKITTCASGYYSYILTSEDYGATWTSQEGSGQRQWLSVVISDDSSRLVAAEFGGNFYTSTDGGVTWSEETDLPSTYLYFLSADGDKLITIDQDGHITTKTY